ncbi:hypothetical protein [Chamaesiphon sp. VAR_48_metabat_403]|uniref:hypothetical protein n=1 Tax=Chamaesiphon sp. VAR_48_metabat_403 TaxID=2964700 RepID=UPI00286E5BCD|nr:hypothetical protein [Chamaesiphon sp. VAR_48_metabat_403]
METIDRQRLRAPTLHYFKTRSTLKEFPDRDNRSKLAICGWLLAATAICTELPG